MQRNSEATTGRPRSRLRSPRRRLLCTAAVVVVSVCALGWEALTLRDHYPIILHSSILSNGSTTSYDKRETSLSVDHLSTDHPLWMPPLQAGNSSLLVDDEEEEPIIIKEEEQTVLVVTFLFGEKTLKKRSVRMFVESARRCGINVALVGSPPPTFPLPPNVKYVETTWDDLTDRVRDRVFDGQEPGQMRSLQNYYKINDFKPLFAHLYPEVVSGYDWWGYCDSDLILGNMRRFLTPRMLSNFDIISPIRDNYTMGPFQLFRNTPVVNELFRLARRPLMELFGTTKCRSFDEYGGNFYGIPVGYNFGFNDYKSSMGGIIENNYKRLGLRWIGGGLPFAWDGFCRGYLSGGVCRECHLLKLSEERQVLKQKCFGYFGHCERRQEVFLCHYQYSKMTMEDSLSDEQVMEELIQEGQFRVNFMEGFKPLNTPSREYLDGTEHLLMPPFESSSPRTFVRPTGQKKITYDPEAPRLIFSGY